MAQARNDTPARHRQRALTMCRALGNAVTIVGSVAVFANSRTGTMPDPTRPFLSRARLAGATSLVLLPLPSSRLLRAERAFWTSVDCAQLAGTPKEPQIALMSVGTSNRVHCPASTTHPDIEPIACKHQIITLGSVGAGDGVRYDLTVSLELVPRLLEKRSQGPLGVLTRFQGTLLVSGISEKRESHSAC
jgi:hypothetical protein